MSAVPFDPVGALFAALARDPNVAPAFARIFRTKPATVQVTVGYVHPDDDKAIAWQKPVQMTRLLAAEALRTARRSGLKVERSVEGYEISGALHPGWRYP